MTALDWIRSKATVQPSLSTTFDYEGKPYRSEWKQFRGNLPYRMRKELTGSKLIKDELENEILHIFCSPSGHQTGIVEYTHITYTEAR